MKLEFEQKIVPDGLSEELDFYGFLSLFDMDIPLLPRKILRPLTAEKGKGHFRRLQDLQKQIEQKKLDLEKIIVQSQKLPLLDFVLPFLENQSLEQFHLYSLGKFVSENQILQELEMECPIAPESSECCLKIKAILETHTQKQFSGLRYTPEEQKLREKIEKLGQDLRTKLSQYEQKIYQQTGLKMIYPYPKEISQEAENFSKIQNCKLISVTCKQDINLINYRLSPYIKNIMMEKDTLSKKFTHLMEKTLKKINKELHPFFKAFRNYYGERKNQTFYYVLLLVKHRQSLCFPKFQTSPGCTLKNAILPSLGKQKKEKYIPLSVDLDRGANVLFGANMTGKTTVLKTIYFHLTAIRMGLPVPAECIQLHFPEQVELHLKSAGNIRRNLSSFGEEIEFFTKEIAPSAYILVDELFQSTDPVGGTELSKIFLLDFSHKNLVFFCTSHYPEVLHLQDISLFRMKDVDFDEEMEYNFIFNNLLEKIPYQIQRIFPENIGNALKESRKPLFIALHFPLPESIKEKIREQLKG